MEQVIRFRTEIETFTDREYQIFRKKLFQKYGERELLIKAISFMLLDQSKRGNCTDTNKINAIFKEVTDLRRKNKKTSKLKEDEKQSNNNFNKLPSALISNTASYLRTNEQPNFMYCNRYIFVSCASTPSTIQKLNLHWFGKYLSNYDGHPICASNQLTKLSRFRMVKDISLPFTWTLTSEWICKRLNRLSLYDDSHDWTHRSHRVESETGFLEQWVHVINNSQIKRLDLLGQFADRWLDDADETRMKQWKARFCKLLSAAMNCDFLAIGDSMFYYQRNGDFAISDEVISSLLRGGAANVLRGISLKFSGLCSNSFTFKLLQSKSDTVQSLHLWNVHNLREAPESSVRYNELEELFISGTNFVLMSNIFATAKKLKRIQWNLTNDRFASSHGIQNRMDEMFTKLTDLDYLCIKPLPENEITIIEKLVEIMERGMAKKENFKLRILLSTEENLMRTGQPLPWCLSVKNHIKDIVDALDDFVSSDFVLTCEIILNDISYVMIVKTQMEERKNFLDRNYSVDIHHEKVAKQHVIKLNVANKGNKMNGYRVRWLYDPEE